MHFYLIFALFTIISFFHSVSSTPSNQYQSLEFNEHVEKLNAKTFDEFYKCNEKKEKCMAKCVMFYTSSTLNTTQINELATKTQQWKMIKFGSINCKQQINWPLCLQHEFMDHNALAQAEKFEREAMLKYFPPNPSTKSTQLKANEDVSKMTQNLIDSMIKDYQQNFYSHWPNIFPLPKNTFYSELWQAQEPTTQYILLAFVENGIDYETMNFLTQCKQIKPKLKVRVAEKGSIIALFVGAQKYPSFVLIRRNELPQTDWEGNELESLWPKFKTLAEEYEGFLDGLNVEFYERYAKYKQITGSGPYDDVVESTELLLYGPSDDYGKTLSFHSNNKYDGIQLRLKRETKSTNDASQIKAGPQKLALLAATSFALNGNPTGSVMCLIVAFFVFLV